LWFNINNVECNKVAFIHKHLVYERYRFAEALFIYLVAINSGPQLEIILWGAKLFKGGRAKTN